MKKPIRSLEFHSNQLHLIDQRKLPAIYEEFICKNYKDVEYAIADMVVRGAPAIGVTAAYGVVLAAQEFKHLNSDNFKIEMHKACDIINKARPGCWRYQK